MLGSIVPVWAISMKEILQLVELVIAILLMAVVLLQQQGSSIGGAFGAEGFAYRGRRGVERLLFQATIVLGILFAGVAIAILIVLRS